MSQTSRRELIFSGKNRTINTEDEISLTSVGIDIGSSTSHLAFSRIKMERRDSRYVVKSRALLFESPLRLTPYIGGADIDATALQAFIEEQYQRAGLTLQNIDAGVLILTGVAAQRANARVIGEALALHTGKLVAVSAGDMLETTLVAHGAGAVQLSRDAGLRVMAVDVGGGTSKIAICSDGEILDRAVVDVGARLICLDEAGRVTSIEAAGHRFAIDAGITLRVGDTLPEDSRRKLAERMADRLFQAMAATPSDGELGQWLRTPPLRERTPPDVLLYSGGVAEYLHGRERDAFGDLGPVLAAAIEHRSKAWRIPTRAPLHGIRATVMGASQYTVQLSGSTIFVAPEDTLPLRNVMALSPRLPLGGEAINRSAIAAEVRRAIEPLDAHNPAQCVALCLQWEGSASYGRLDAFCRGVIDGLKQSLSRGHPLVIVTDTDIGGLIGMHCRQECGLVNAVVSIDGIALSELDFIDVGEILESSGAVPVVIKSLLFPVAASTATVD